MAHNIAAGNIGLLISVALGFIACQSQKPKDSPAQVSDTTISVAHTNEQLPEEPGHANHSLPELDTATVPPQPLSLFRGNGEIYLVDSLASQITQLTFTGARIDTFFISPNRKYVACLKVVAIAKEPGEWGDEEPPDARRYSILVVAIPKGAIIRELTTTDFNLYFTKWISNSRFHYTTNDGFAVSEFYVYDAFRDSLQLLRYGAEE